MPMFDFPFLMLFFPLGFYFRIPSRHQLLTWGEKKCGEETKSNLPKAQVKSSSIFFFSLIKIYIYLQSFTLQNKIYIYALAWKILHGFLADFMENTVLVSVRGYCSKKDLSVSSPIRKFHGKPVWKLVLSFQFSMLVTNYCVFLKHIGRIALDTLQ